MGYYFHFRVVVLCAWLREIEGVWAINSEYLFYFNLTLEIKILTKQLSCINRRKKWVKKLNKSSKNPGNCHSQIGLGEKDGVRDIEKSKLNKTIKLLLNCDALNLIRLIKNRKQKKGES